MIRRTKLFLVILCTVTVFVLICVTRTEKSMQVVAAPTVGKIQGPEKMVLMHLDLKGAPPKIGFLLELLPLARRAGANGLLIEYEDSFPWSGVLRNVSAGNAYSVDEVLALVRVARELGMEVIPLVQTFGHLEFVLKLKEFRHLRELDTFPQEVCPSKPESFQLIKEMIKQVMAVHKNTRYLHIGCDEVYHIAACSVCSKHNQKDIFSKHVKRVAEHIRMNYPGVTPIIWDDMLRHWSPIDIEESGLGEHVEPMIWVYIDDIPRLVPHFIWFVYKKTFQKLWAASAFKGAFGEKQTLPDVNRHMENTLAWMRLILPRDTDNTITKSEDFKGIALTGWSRYDHFAVLSELLPVAVPSLILNLALTRAYFVGDGEEHAYERVVEILRCARPFPVEEMRRGELFFGHCEFPGRGVYQLVLNYQTLVARYQMVMKQLESNGWVAEYNVRYRYTSPYRLLELFPEEGFAAENLLKGVRLFKVDAGQELGKFYDQTVVDEWIEEKIGFIEGKLVQLGRVFQDLVEIKTWPRRPLN